MFRRFAGLLALVLALAVCGEAAPFVPQFDGVWTANLNGIAIELRPLEQDGSIHGTGTAEFESDTAAIDFEGLHVHPDILLHLFFRFPDTDIQTVISGAFADENTITGELGGEAITLIRQ